MFTRNPAGRVLLYTDRYKPSCSLRWLIKMIDLSSPDYRGLAATGAILVLIVSVVSRLPHAWMSFKTAYSLSFVLVFLHVINSWCSSVISTSKMILDSEHGC